MTQHTPENTPGRFRGGLNRLEAGVREALRLLRQYFALLLDPNRAWKHRLGYAALGLAGVAGAMVHYIMMLLVLLIPFTPGFSSIEAARIDNPSIVLSADGEELVRYHRINRKWVTLDEVSPVVVDALIATEDHRFYRHYGIDPSRAVGSVVHTLLGDMQGGSTLTMQLARNIYPEQIGQAFAPMRKLKEMITAVKIETVYSKQEIIETYLNTVPFLYNTNGIEMAAQTYFNKTAAELDTLEAATLVGMLKGTAYYNPARNPERAQLRRNVVLGQMARRGVLPEEQLVAMQAAPVELDFQPQSILKSRAPHFTAHLKEALQTWADQTGHDLYTDGLVIHTTLDMDLQDLAQQAVERQTESLQAVADVEWGRSPVRLVSTNASAYGSARENVKPFDYFWRTHPEILEEAVRNSVRFRNGVAAGQSEAEMLTILAEDESYLDSVKTAESRVQAGFVAIDPNTGHVKAWVGSADFYTDQYDHVARAKRQPGSTFKPFVYAAALDNGYSPNDIFWDRPVEIRMDDGAVWRPTNSGDVSGQPMTLRAALTHSKNTITAQLMERVGPEQVADYAHQMGIESKLDKVPSLALGTSDVSLLEMVSAYGTIASEGTHRPPVLVTRIDDEDGNVLATFSETPREGLNRDTALRLLDMMRGVVDEGTAAGLRWRFGIEGDLAGKTGTTQESADGWFILMHPDLVAGSWMGFNDRRITFRSSYWGQGAHNALFVVGDFFQAAVEQDKIDVGARFPNPPPSASGRDRQFWDRFGRWVTDAADDLGDALRGELAIEPRPLEGLSDRERREAEREAEREERRQEQVEERVERMREEALREAERAQERADRMRERQNESGGARRGW
jgi:penicillin-binding protein 1A